MQKKLPLSYIEISKEHLLHNIRQFRAVVAKNTKIAAVIKANAYGHGEKEVVSILAPHVDYFQVNSVEELESVRKVTKKQILLFGYVAQDDIERAITLGCILTVVDLRHALLINEAARKLGKKPARPDGSGHSGRQKVHIALDCHLGREGVMPSDLDAFLKEIQKMKYLVVDGVYAHFANIEDTADFSHAELQIRAFENAVKLFHSYGYKNIQTHISATSGVLAYEKWKGLHSLVRIGIGLYGMWPSEELENIWKKKITLKPIIRFVTHIAQVKVIPAGESIGYGLSYVTKIPMTVAVIPQGYSNGFPRVLSNSGEVLIRGKRAPVLGRVAMNMFVVDVSHIKGVQAEDEVVLLGTQGKPARSGHSGGDAITAEELAEKEGTINYEATTRLSPLLPRVITK